MGSYELIKGKDDQIIKNRNNYSLQIDGFDQESRSIDVESASRKLNASGGSGGGGGGSGGGIRSTHLVSLDVFRGLTVALMILVDNAGRVLPSINHSPWSGLTLADFVMPFFLFIVGVAIGIACKNVSCRIVATKKAMYRVMKLLLLGLFLQGGFFHNINDLTYGVDIKLIRWMGILQRIEVAYMLAVLCEIWLKSDGKVTSGLSLLKKYRIQWGVALALTVLYLFLLYGLYVPDWEFQVPAKFTSPAKILGVNCGVRGDTGPACNAVGMIDRKILGIEHLYRKPIYGRTTQCSTNSPDYGPLPPDAPSWCQAPFDPEGLLSSVMAVVTCLFGLHYGHIIIHFKGHRRRILLWMITSCCLVVFGILLHLFGMHMNKALYTVSYMCVTTGAGGILFAAIYTLVDTFEYKCPTFVLEWMGANALLIYVFIACNILPIVLQGFYWRQPQNNILRLLGIGA